MTAHVKSAVVLIKISLFKSTFMVLVFVAFSINVVFCNKTRNTEPLTLMSLDKLLDLFRFFVIM